MDTYGQIWTSVADTGGGSIPHLLQLLILNSEMKDLH